jgi:hypothetical protein
MVAREYTRDSADIPCDKRYEDWTRAWWHWVLQININDSPAIGNDDTGRRTSRDQGEYPDDFDRRTCRNKVWFLAGTTGGSAVRRSIVPSGRSILCPIYNCEACDLEFPETSEEDLFEIATSDIRQVNVRSADIDGFPLIGEQVQINAAFDLELQNDNILGVSPGQTRIVSDGFWIFIYPLERGDHRLHIRGASPFFDNEVTYYLSVLGGK